jgi:hypothetical protein
MCDGAARLLCLTGVLVWQLVTLYICQTNHEIAHILFIQAGIACLSVLYSAEGQQPKYEV